VCELDVIYWSPETGEPVFAVALWPLLSARSSFLPVIVLFTLNPIRPCIKQSQPKLRNTSSKFQSKNTCHTTFCSHWRPLNPTSRPFFHIDQMLMYQSIPTPASSFLFGLPSGLAKEKLKNNEDKEPICFKLNMKYSRQ